MHAQPKKRTVVENVGDGGIGPGLAAAIANGEDLGPIVRHVFEFGKPEAILHHLRNIVKKKEAEIEDACKLHYEEFILAVDELKGVLADADNLRTQVMLQEARLQEEGLRMLAPVDELIELEAVKRNVRDAIKALKACVHVTSLCFSCNRDVSEGRFYPALNTLDLIEKDYHSIPVKTLRRVISKQLPAIKLHIEKKVCGEFNDWLVHIRTNAKEIGQLSIRQTATARQRDEEMRSRQREAEEQSRTGSTAFNEYVYSLTEQAEEDVVLDFKLTAVHRAYHIYSCLGIGEKFRDYYHKNRLMQLQLDLQVSTMQPFLESHQPFLAQVAGFFIVESRVLQSAGGLLTEEQVESTWDTAIAKITAILEDQFARLDTASHLLLIKDYVSLLGVTLKRYGYRIGPLMDILDKSRDKYHELLLTECRRQISEILTNDSYEQLKLNKEHEYNTNVLMFNLQDMDMVLDLPCNAPFSSSVPEVCRVIRSFIEDSISYLSYGGGFIVSSYEVVKKYLDKLLIEVLNNTLLNIIHGGAFSVPQAMQIGSNISAFERACDCFFLWQAGQLCGIPKRIVERPHSGLTAKAVLKAAQNVAYNKLLDLVNDRLDSIMGQMSNINWIAEEVPEHANDYMNEVLVYLDSVVSTAQNILPLEALYKVTIGALGHVSDYVMAAFLSDNLKRFTVSAVSSVDIDWKLLESFAEERYHSTGVIEIGKDTTFADCLVEVRQLLNLLLSNQPENFINPVIRAKNYGMLDHKKVAVICEKYKDAPDRLFGSLSNRNTKQSARKKSMDVLKKRLKDMS